MSQAKLETVTLQTLASATEAAEQAVQAYRVGSHRLIRVLDSRVSGPAVAGAQRLSPRAAKLMAERSSQAQRLATQGVDLVSDRADAVIAAGSATAARQVKRLASRVIYLEQGQGLADLSVDLFFNQPLLEQLSPQASAFVKGETV